MTSRSNAILYAHRTIIVSLVFYFLLLSLYVSQNPFACALTYLSHKILLFIYQVLFILHLQIFCHNEAG